MMPLRLLNYLQFKNLTFRLLIFESKIHRTCFVNKHFRCFSVNPKNKNASFRNISSKFFHPTYLNMRKQYNQPRVQKYVIKPVYEFKQKELSHTALVKKLLNCKSVNEQIDCFDAFVKLPNEELTHRSTVCRKLEEVLKPYYSSCSVHLVGSSVNGLGLKGCDVDLSLQHMRMNTNNTLIHGNASFLEEISEGNLPKKKLYEFTPKVQLATIRKILQDLKFEGPITVIPGRCPILSFCYNNLSCDLAINNSSALHGTNLMLFCGKLDERVPKLVRIISYWAKHSKLVGGITKFKSYAMFLLVVYFLQTRNPPILPPVEVIFEKTEFKSNLNNWSYNIENYLHAFRPSENTQNIEELLREFFFFYGNYDFNYIICPISGNAMDRKKFASEVDCVNNFVLNSMCIQDPINLSWNVTTEVGWKICKNFLKSTVSVCEMYQNREHCTPKDSLWGLAALIDGKFSVENLKDIKELSIDIPLLHKGDSDCPDQEESLKLSADLVHKLFSYCLLFPCYPVNSSSNLSLLDIPANVKAAVKNHFFAGSTKQTNGAHFDVAHYVCAAKDSWLGRNTFSVPSNEKNAFEIEHEVSKKMDSMRGVSDKELFYFLCSVWSENRQLQVTLKPLNSNRFIPKLAIFLKEFVPRLVQRGVLDS